MGQFERLRAIEDDLRVRIMTCEAEILFFLQDSNGRKLQELCDGSKYSHVTIHEYIRKLIADEIIIKGSFDGDRRRVSYMLTDKAAKVLEGLCEHIEHLRYSAPPRAEAC